MTDTRTRTRRDTGRTGAYVAVSASVLLWIIVSVMNYAEQEYWADENGLRIPSLLPLAFDGMYVVLAVVALVASLDGRAGIAARIGTLVSVAGSAAVSANAARMRTTIDDPNSYVAGVTTYRADVVIVAAVMPILAFVAFEVALAEIRRQVQKDRGRTSPVPIPFPRAVRWALSPFRTSRVWRRIVLDLTDREMIVPDGTVVAVPEPAPVPVRVVSVSNITTEPDTDQNEETIVSETVTRSVTHRSAPGRRSVPDEDYVETARRAVALIRERGQALTRDGFVSAMAELDMGVGTVRAARLLKREDVTS